MSCQERMHKLLGSYLKIKIFIEQPRIHSFHFIKEALLELEKGQIGLNFVNTYSVIFSETVVKAMEKAMARHSSTLAWKIPWMEQPDGLLSLVTVVHWRRKWQPTPVFLSGEPQGRGSPMGCVYGVAESDTTEVTQQQQQDCLQSCYLLCLPLKSSIATLIKKEVKYHFSVTQIPTFIKSDNF